MLRGLFVTGTDTDVGKTTVAAALMLRYRELRVLKYWKPIQTGIELDDDTMTVDELAGCTENELHTANIRLPRPLAPYLSAELSGTHITIADLIRRVDREAEETRWIVEGAGGVLVPINESESMLDLIVTLGMPAVVVARSTLGTINHTLLTLQALRHRNVEIAGVVMVGHKNEANREAIRRFGAVTVVDEMPHFASLTSDALRLWATSDFDTNGIFGQYFK
jgi:dethiobiotin synthase